MTRPDLRARLRVPAGLPAADLRAAVAAMAEETGAADDIVAKALGRGRPDPKRHTARATEEAVAAFDLAAGKAARRFQERIAALLGGE